MSIKSFGKVLLLSLHPFDALQNAIGAFGLIINLLVSLGIPIGTSLAWLYFPDTQTQENHIWLAVGIGLLLFLVFVVIAATKLQIEKDKLNEFNIVVQERIYSDGPGKSAVLEVTNKSNLMELKANARLFGDIHHGPQLYDLWWESPGGSQVRLGNGDTGAIKVAYQTVQTNVPTIMGLSMVKATNNGTQLFPSALSLANAAYKWEPGIVYVEIVIRPISSSTKEYKATYALEQPSVTQFKFYKVDSMPSVSDREDSQS